MGVLRLIISFYPYLSSAMVRFPLKTSCVISYSKVKRIKYSYRYIILVIRKHTRQAPKEFDDWLRLALS